MQLVSSREVGQNVEMKSDGLAAEARRSGPPPLEMSHKVPLSGSNKRPFFSTRLKMTRQDVECLMRSPARGH